MKIGEATAKMYTPPTKMETKRRDDGNKDRDDEKNETKRQSGQLINPCNGEAFVNHDMVCTQETKQSQRKSLMLSKSNGSPLLDFEDLTVVLSTLLLIVCSYIDIKECTYFSVGLKTYNEVQHCFLTVGLVYPEGLFIFLVNKSKLKEVQMTFGALCVRKHLLPRLSEAWHNKRPTLIEGITLLLEEQNLGVCTALTELIVVMASHCYFVGLSGELFVEYLVRHCAMSDQEIDELVTSKDSFSPANLYYPFQQKRAEERIGSLQPTELKAICEKGLLLIIITIPEMEHVPWPFVLKMIIPRLYTGAVSMLCSCISDICSLRSIHNDRMIRECRTRVDIPRPKLFARLVVLLHNPLAREQLAIQILTLPGKRHPKSKPLQRF